MSLDESILFSRIKCIQELLPQIGQCHKCLSQFLKLPYIDCKTDGFVFHSRDPNAIICFENFVLALQEIDNCSSEYISQLLPFLALPGCFSYLFIVSLNAFVSLLNVIQFTFSSPTEKFVLRLFASRGLVVDHYFITISEKWSSANSVSLSVP